jgi:ABC-2 type transport system ATP-binding protein
VRTPDPARLAQAIAAAGGSVTDAGEQPDGGAAALSVTGMPAARIGEIAAAASVVLHELTPRAGSLEEAFMELTADSLEYGQPGRPGVAGQTALTGSAITGRAATGPTATGPTARPGSGGQGR